MLIYKTLISKIVHFHVILNILLSNRCSSKLNDVVFWELL